MRDRPITRRELLGGALALGVGALGCGEGPGSAKGSGEAGARVVLAPMAKPADAAAVEAAARVAIEELGGLGWLSRGDVVLLKPASNSANRYPATTRPELITAIARILREAGASRVILGDLPGVQTVLQEVDRQRGSARGTLEANGIAAAALAGGAEVVGFDEAGYDGFFEAVARDASHWQGPLMLPALLRQVDHVVLLPRLSTHLLAGATLALKSAVGWLRQDSRLELHRDAASFFEKTAEITAAGELRDRIRLIVTEASRAQTTIGPDSGYAATLDPPLLMASANPAMHDVAAHGVLSYARTTLTPDWARALETYPGGASATNAAFVALVWGVRQGLATQRYVAPPLGRALDNPVIRRGVEILSPNAERPTLYWTAEAPSALRDAVTNA